MGEIRIRREAEKREIRTNPKYVKCHTLKIPVHSNHSFLYPIVVANSAIGYQVSIYINPGWTTESPPFLVWLLMWFLKDVRSEGGLIGEGQGHPPGATVIQRLARKSHSSFFFLILYLSWNSYGCLDELSPNSFCYKYIHIIFNCIFFSPQTD